MIIIISFVTYFYPSTMGIKSINYNLKTIVNISSIIYYASSFEGEVPALASETVNIKYIKKVKPLLFYSHQSYVDL